MYTRTRTVIFVPVTQPTCT